LIRLNRGVTNALSHELVEELSETLRQARDDAEVRGIVLGTANDKFFSIGWDIPQLFDVHRDAFRTFFRAFNDLCIDLLTLPKPTAAAITGHAVAGGCILALCCDYRFIARGRNLMGLNEIKLGVPVPYLADRVLRSLVGLRKAREIMDGGEFYEAETCRRLGMVDEVLPSGEVVERALGKARSLGAFPPEAYAMIKRSRTEEIEAAISVRGTEKDRHFIECWYSESARERLREAMKRF
jgi:enoyl-CoA hydratase/carnithine racemase